MRKPVQDVVKLHEHVECDDVDSTWAVGKGNNAAYLLLEFQRPVKTEAAIEFDILGYECLVDTIMSTRVFILQPDKKGDRISNIDGNPSITIEVPGTGFRKIWSKKREMAIIKNLRGKAKKASRKMIDDWRSSFCISLKEHSMIRSKGCFEGDLE